MRSAIYSDNSCGSEITGFSVDEIECTHESRIIGAPVETGTISFDNKVLDPYRLVVTGHIEDFGDSGSIRGANINNSANDAWATILAMYQTRTFKFFSVSDSNVEYTDLILESVREKKTPNKFDWREYQLVYRQAMFVQKGYSSSNQSPMNAENTNTRRTGISL